MTLPVLALWLVRAFGLAWAVGGVFVIRQVRAQLAVADVTRELERVLAKPGDHEEPEDRGRLRWLLAGGVLTSVAGAALALALPVAVWALGGLVLHQLAYVTRQNRRARLARSSAGADDARPAQSTLNAAITSAVVLLVVLWLTREGVIGMWPITPR